eukprot:m.96120 g.96120  ORF g.96120 m.96120 type:complete len:65 (+) comp51316_c0_seq5:402-596(+)
MTALDYAHQKQWQEVVALLEAFVALVYCRACSVPGTAWLAHKTRPARATASRRSNGTWRFNPSR